MKRVMFFGDNQLCCSFLENIFLGTDISINKYDEHLDFFNQIVNWNIDLILLDRNIGALNGLVFLEKLKQQEALYHIPTIVFSSHFDLDLKIAAYELGALDCISLNDSPTEIVARVKNKLKFYPKGVNNENPLTIRPTSGVEMPKVVLHSDGDCFTYGDLRVDFFTHQVFDKSGGSYEWIPLSFLDYKILVFLLKNIDRNVSRQTLIKSVWGNNIHISNRTVDVHISGLRKKSKTLEKYIKTIYGKGYFFSKENDGVNSFPYRQSTESQAQTVAKVKTSTNNISRYKGQKRNISFQ